METSVDPRIRPSLGELALQSGRTSPADRPQPAERSREPFANRRTGGTDEVTTLGPGSEAKTAEAELRFGDLVDLINPLQHIPVVSALYRSVTGDEIVPAARIMGSMIYTGPLGFVYATADSLFAEISGRPFGDTLASAVLGTGQAEPEPASDLAEEPVPAPAGKPQAEEGPRQAKQTAPTAEAPTAEALTGNEALLALASDLRLLARGTSSGGNAAATGTLAQTGEPSGETMQQNRQSASETKPVVGFSPSIEKGRGLPAPGQPPELSTAFAHKMTEALDKYRAMAEARRLEEAQHATPSDPPAQIP